MYPFSLIDPPTLLLVSIAVFTLTGIFMAIAGRIRGERAYTWLSVGALAFATGWALNLSQYVYGVTVVTLPVAEILLLMLPLCLLCATIEFLRLPGLGLTLLGSAVTLTLAFWVLVVFIDNETVPGAMTSSLNGAAYLAVARLFYIHAYPHNLIGGIIIGAIVIIGTAFILRTIFLMYGVAVSDALGPELRRQVLYAMLLIDLMGIFMLALCFPLFDFVRTETILHSTNAQLTQLAERDPLTGTYNRRVFITRLETELQRHRQTSLPLSLILFDIDHFKQVNDTHGHGIGDQALRHVVETAHRHLRGSDLLARFGGEEFIILLPETPLAGARGVAERIRGGLEGNPAKFPHMAALRITSSFGVVCTDERHRTMDELLGAADLAMYAAKHAGRNRVRSEPLQDEEPTGRLGDVAEICA
ncbi:GGDEF domain-containing protein [uncultured Thiodictyon sp.]|uniref:GGDEF domain-containing protein n=1 Tax=uncultured Thiodictyon sp. TaxID=1846217 RepID=UPI002600D8A1|nr:GGDEF domain-containing protein [uncultured Thiodictyon sp.]